MLNNIINILEENKVQNIKIYDNVRGEGVSYVVCSAFSNKHTRSVAAYITQDLKHEYDYTVEGLEEGNWVLVWVDNLMIHIFHDAVRQYYNVDQLWNSLVEA